LLERDLAESLKVHFDCDNVGEAKEYVGYAKDLEGRRSVNRFGVFSNKVQESAKLSVTEAELEAAA
jgi:hypothetical protein